MRQFARMGALSDFLPDGIGSGGDVSSATDASVSAANDVSKRIAEAQQTAIVSGAQSAAGGFSATAAQIQSSVTKSIATVAIVGGALFFIGRHFIGRK